MNVLADTSVWVDHFKQRNECIVSLLEGDRVVCHQGIPGEREQPFQ